MCVITWKALLAGWWMFCGLCVYLHGLHLVTVARNPKVLNQALTGTLSKVIASLGWRFVMVVSLMCVITGKGLMATRWAPLTPRGTICGGWHVAVDACAISVIAQTLAGLEDLLGILKSKQN